MLENSQKINVITIDGPGGSGKGTLATRLAKHFKWHYLDSGVHFRALGYLAIKKQVDPKDVKKLLLFLEDFNLTYKFTNDGELEFNLNGEDISAKIRQESCSSIASKIAVHQDVRSAIVKLQRACLEPPGLVTDGRDMATVVFPDAKWKIYLHASLDKTANRRYQQLKNKDINVSLESVLSDMKQRDMRDSGRKVAPLRVDADAYFLDTDNLSIEQVFQKALLFIENGTKT